MRKTTKYVLYIVIVIGSFVAGSLFAIHYHVNTQLAIDQLESNVYTSVTTLSELRKGHVDEIIQQKEAELDMHILALGMLAHERGKIGADARLCLHRVILYRKNQNYISTDPDIRLRIEEAFKVVTP